MIEQQPAGQTGVLPHHPRALLEAADLIACGRTVVPNSSPSSGGREILLEVKTDFVDVRAETKKLLVSSAVMLNEVAPGQHGSQRPLQ